MKKFSSHEIKTEKTSISPKRNELIKLLVKENIDVLYDGDENDIFDKQINIQGQEELIEKINSFIAEEKEKYGKILTENLKYQYGLYVNHVQINGQIKILENSINDFLIASPIDIFSNEDYTLEGKKIIFNKLDNIPVDYLDYLNMANVNKFFEESNKLAIEYVNPNESWTILFTPNLDNYGTSVDETDEKYKLFIKENKEFIADFLEATNNLIGSKNIKIDGRLLNNLK